MPCPINQYKEWAYLVLGGLTKNVYHVLYDVFFPMHNQVFKAFSTGWVERGVTAINWSILLSLVIIVE